MKLQPETLDNIERKAKSYKLFDGHGLYAEIPPTGNIRWRFKYTFERKEKKLSLGLYPEISISQVRQAAEAIRRSLKQKIDPAIAIQQGKKRLKTAYTTSNDALRGLSLARKDLKKRMLAVQKYVDLLNESILKLQNMFKD